MQCRRSVGKKSKKQRIVTKENKKAVISNSPPIELPPSRSQTPKVLSRLRHQQSSWKARDSRPRRISKSQVPKRHFVPPLIHPRENQRMTLRSLYDLKSRKVLCHSRACFWIRMRVLGKKGGDVRSLVVASSSVLFFVIIASLVGGGGESGGAAIFLVVVGTIVASSAEQSWLWGGECGNCGWGHFDFLIAWSFVNLNRRLRLELGLLFLSCLET